MHATCFGPCVDAVVAVDVVDAVDAVACTPFGPCVVAVAVVYVVDVVDAVVVVYAVAYTPVLDQAGCALMYITPLGIESSQRPT